MTLENLDENSLGLALLLTLFCLLLTLNYVLFLFFFLFFNFFAAYCFQLILYTLRKGDDASWKGEIKRKGSWGPHCRARTKNVYLCAQLIVLEERKGEWEEEGWRRGNEEEEGCKVSRRGGRKRRMGEVGWGGWVMSSFMYQAENKIKMCLKDVVGGLHTIIILCKNKQKQKRKRKRKEKVRIHTNQAQMYYYINKQQHIA